MSDLLIDCDTCIARGPGCGDCVMTVLLSIAPHRPAVAQADRTPVRLDDAERQAVQALAEAGLVPPLRLVSGLSYDVQDIA